MDIHQLESCTSSAHTNNGSPSKVFVPTRRKRKQPVHRIVTMLPLCQDDDLKISPGCIEQFAKDVNANKLPTSLHSGQLPSVTPVSKGQGVTERKLSDKVCIKEDINNIGGSSNNNNNNNNSNNSNNNDITNNNNNSNSNDDVSSDVIDSVCIVDSNIAQHESSSSAGGDTQQSDTQDANKTDDVAKPNKAAECEVGGKDVLSEEIKSLAKKCRTKASRTKHQVEDMKLSGARSKKKKKKRNKLCQDAVNTADRCTVVTKGDDTLQSSEVQKSSSVGLKSKSTLENRTTEMSSQTHQSKSSVEEPLKLDAESPEAKVAASGNGMSMDDLAKSLCNSQLVEVDVCLSSSGRKLCANSSPDKLTPEEIDILNMFYEVESSDQSHSSPPLSAKGSPTKAQNGKTDSSPGKDRAVVNKRRPQLSTAVEADMEASMERQATEEECTLHSSVNTKHLMKALKHRTEQEEAQKKRNEECVVVGRRVLTRKRGKRMSNNSETDSVMRKKALRKDEGEEEPELSDAVTEMSENEDVAVQYKLRSSPRNAAGRLSQERSTLIQNQLENSERDGSFDKKYVCEFCSYMAQSSSHIMVHTRTHTGERPFKCRICKKGFIQQSALRVHLRIHSNMRPYSCGICRSAFRTSGHLSDHLRIHTGERPYMCITCRKTFRISSHLQAHIKIHNNERSYKCNMCKKAFIQSSQLKIHKKTHNRQAEAIYGCDLCKKKFLLPWNLQLHMRAVHSQGHKPYKCERCEKSFTIKAYLARHKKSVHGSMRLTQTACPVCRKLLSKFSMRRHMLTHATEKKYVCKMCSKGFNFSHNLLVHLRVHTESMSYHCPVCEVVFGDLAGMRQHMKKQHRVDPWDKKFWCTTCNRCFFNKGMLARHRREVHTAQRLYACDVCGKAFKNERNLRQHMKGHDKNTFIQCDFCEKRFSQRGNLKIHIRTVHNKIKDFTCSTCSAKFATKRNLLQHVRTHTGEKPFKCKYCTKQFTQGSSLNRHEMTHTGERPFKCDTCQKSFVQKIHLVGHMKTHRTEKCPFCDESVPIKSQLATHVKNHLHCGKYICPPCNKKFADRNQFREHCKKTCQVDETVIGLIVKALGKQEKDESPKACQIKKEPGHCKQLAASRKRRSAANEQKMLENSTPTKLRRISPRKKKGGNCSKDDKIEEPRDENMNRNKDSVHCEKASSATLVEKNNNVSVLNGRLGPEPLNLSVDQNSNTLTVGQKPLTHTYAISDANTKIVLQQL